MLEILGRRWRRRLRVAFRSLVVVVLEFVGEKARPMFFELLFAMEWASVV